MSHFFSGDDPVLVRIQGAEQPRRGTAVGWFGGRCRAFRLLRGKSEHRAEGVGGYAQCDTEWFHGFHGFVGLLIECQCIDAGSFRIADHSLIQPHAC